MATDPARPAPALGELTVALALLAIVAIGTAFCGHLQEVLLGSPRATEGGTAGPRGRCMPCATLLERGLRRLNPRRAPLLLELST
jgi:hypothetical protein